MTVDPQTRLFYGVPGCEQRAMTVSEIRKYLDALDEGIAGAFNKGRKGWIQRKKELLAWVQEQGIDLDEAAIKDESEEITTEEVAPPTRKDKGRIMYVEYKGDDLRGPGRIARVRFSKTGKTIDYRGRKLQSLKGGYKANYFDIATGEHYWVSGCKQNGEDTLYPGVVEIDEDVREEYWREIRGLPENAHLTSIRTSGKYSKRKPK
jgi:hypothetical protein